MVLLSTHNICFGREIRKIFFSYALLSRGLTTLSPNIYPVHMQQFSYNDVFTGRMETCVDPDQKALSEAS